MDMCGCGWWFRGCGCCPVDVAGGSVYVAGGPMDVAGGPVDVASDPPDVAGGSEDVASTQTRNQTKTKQTHTPYC